MVTFAAIQLTRPQKVPQMKGSQVSYFKIQTTKRLNNNSEMSVERLWDNYTQQS